ncbi:hypothetical protein BBR01nite_19010 [Brevibacillus brevis]|nr:hypothetical protein BBR01nite_19010 [Brevibacillus brevis]
MQYNDLKNFFVQTCKTPKKLEIIHSCPEVLSHVWKETARTKRGYRRLENMWQGFSRPQQWDHDFPDDIPLTNARYAGRAMKIWKGRVHDER